MHRILNLLRSKWQFAGALLGIAALWYGWHPITNDYTPSIFFDRLLVVVGAFLLWLCWQPTAPRPYVAPAPPHRSGYPLWFFGVLGAVLWVVLLYWMNPEMAVRGFPIRWGTSPSAFDAADFALFQRIGWACIGVGGLAWLVGWWRSAWVGWLFPLVHVGAVVLTLCWFWQKPQRDLPLLAHYQDPAANDQQVILIFLALFFSVLGVMRLVDVRRMGQRLRDSWRGWRREWLLLALLTGAALALRLYRLGDLFPIMVSDEALYFSKVSQFIKGGLVRRFNNEWLFGEVYLGAHLVSFSVRLFGDNLFAGRVVVALLGAFSIPGVYLVARRLFGVRVAVLACVILATQPVHFHFSRVLLNMPFDPVLGIAAFWLIWDGMERGGAWKFALAGVLVGLAQYFYVGALLWAVLLPAWWGVLLLRQPQRLRREWLPLLLGVGFFLFTALPIPIDAYHRGTMPFQRHQEMSYVEGRDVREFWQRPLDDYLYNSLHPAVRAYYDQGDRTLHFEGIPHMALFLRLGFMLFMLGLVYALRFALHPYVFFLLLWVGMTTFFGGSLTHSSPGYSRYYNALLPLAILSGAGLHGLLRWLAPSSWRRAAFGVALLIVLLGGAQNMHHMFGEHARLFLFDQRRQRFVGDALARSTTEVIDQPNAEVWWLNHTDYTDLYNTRFDLTYIFLRGRMDVNIYNESVNEAWLQSLNTNRNLYLFVAPMLRDPAPALQLLSPRSQAWRIRAAFPESQIMRFSARYPVERPITLYSLVVIPQGAHYCPPDECPRDIGG